MLSLLPEILASVMDALVSCYFIDKFNREKPFSHIASVIYLLVYWAVDSVTIFVRDVPTFYTLFYFAVMLAYALIRCKGRIFKRLLAPIIFESGTILVNSLVIFSWSTWISADFDTVINDSGLGRIIVILLTKTILWVLISLILKTTDGTRFTIRDAFLLILFPAVIYVEESLLFKLAFEYGLNDYSYIFMILSLLLALSYVSVYYLINKTVKYEEEKRQQALRLQMSDYEERRFADINESLNRIRQIRHDIKNDLYVLKLKLDDNDTDSAKEELKKILALSDTSGNRVQTNNRIADYILNTKLSGKPEIEFSVTGSLNGAAAIADSDFSNILGNLIDNALEALEKVTGEKELRIEFFQKATYFNIVCKNTVESAVLEKNPRLNTSKTDNLSHGFGIRSMQEIVKKYHGILDFYEENRMFCVHIMVQIPKTDD